MSTSQVEVLDKGFVRLEDYMGSDLTTVNAARVSFSKRSYWGQKNPIGGNVLERRDGSLIEYLAEHDHWTPFGHIQLTLHFKMPIFVARQFMRSNVGIVYNEVSRRYVDSDPEFYVPLKWRGRPPGLIKQGSSDEEITELKHPDGQEDLWGDADNKHHPTLHFHYACDNMVGVYKHFIESGIAPEMARMLLPLNTYTEFWATMSLAAAARVYRLREDSHAQWEVQQYAHAMNEIIAPLYPVSWKALTNEDQTA